MLTVFRARSSWQRVRVIVKSSNTIAHFQQPATGPQVPPFSTLVASRTEVWTTVAGRRCYLFPELVQRSSPTASTSEAWSKDITSKLHITYVDQTPTDKCKWCVRLDMMVRWSGGCLHHQFKIPAMFLWGRIKPPFVHLLLVLITSFVSCFGSTGIILCPFWQQIVTN